MKKAAKAIIKFKDEVLIIYRSDTHPKYPLHPDLPGGLLDGDEDEKTALIRELMEEINYDASKDKIIFIKEATNPFIKRSLYLVLIQKKPKIELSWEHESFKWIKIDQLKFLDIPKSSDPYLSDLLKNIDIIRKY